MKRLEFFPLTHPHHPREVFVMAVDEGHEPRLMGITVWEADPQLDTARVGPPISCVPAPRGAQPLVVLPSFKRTTLKDIDETAYKFLASLFKHKD